MGNIQTNDKQSKTGKSPAKGKHFIRNLNRKSSGKDKKHGKKKSDAKREAVDREFDKTPDSDNIEQIGTYDNDAVECASNTQREGAGGCGGVHSQVTVCRCEPRSATRDQPAVSPANDSTSESVFTDPLTPLAVELNQCYYSAESDSAPDDLQRTLTPSLVDVPAHHALISTPGSVSPAIDMPHDDATSTLLTDDMVKEERNDTLDDSSDKSDEKVMGTIFSGQRGEHSERNTHECNHDFRDNRLKACPGQTSFTLSKHRKVELPPVACDPSLNILDNEIDRRHSSLSDVPVTDSNVLRKVASLTLDKLSETKIVRPKFVPEKLDFQLHEKFEGQMLLNWFASSVAENNHLKALLNPQDLKSLGIQYFTHLLAAGVLRQLSDNDAPPETIFKTNLMYNWAHMEVPLAQPVTPGRLQMTAWHGKDRQHTHEHVTNVCHLENTRNLNQNNNEEISDISEAKAVISQLKLKLIELEFQLEKYKINSDIETISKNSDNGLDSENNLYNRKKIELLSKEVSQVTSKVNKLSDRPVINISECDPHLRTNVNIDSTLDVSSISNNIENITERSEKIENYCKLNKSREQCFVRKEDVHQSIENIDNNDIITKIDLKRNDATDIKPRLGDLDNFNASVPCGSSSEASFLSTCTSNELLSSESASSASENNTTIPVHNMTNKINASAVVLFNNVNGTHFPVSNISQTSLSEHKNASLENENIKTESMTTSPNESLPSIPTPPITEAPSETCSFTSAVSQPRASPPPPLPGVAPPPPPTPGTFSSRSESHMTPVSGIISSPSPLVTQEMVSSSSTMPESQLSALPMSGMAPPPPPMPEMSEYSPLIPGIASSPPISSMAPAPPPMPGMAPPPPPMPGMIPTLTSNADMAPPPPPMPGMAPPPPPMIGMAPPPPPMPGIGPLLPPMPGMTPMPPPLPGSGPPPPPGMPGLGPTPPVPPLSNVGPVPFPAPPVGGWNMQRATMRKTPVKPAAPMKPLYWTRILAPPPQPSLCDVSSIKIKPLWLEIEETNLDNIDEFTDLFSRQVVKAPVKKKVEVKTKIQPVKILDSKRSQNVGILAQSLHVEFTEIENAIYNFDTSVVSLEALQQIYELRGTEEELEMIKGHLKNKPNVPLDKPEGFLHDLSGIPNFAERISCFMFQADFEDAVSTTMHKLDNLRHTCEFLMTSESLKMLFAIILTLGNYMNGGNGQRGQADGFGLEILSKLKDVKSKQSTVTLLHFIVRTYMRRGGDALAEGSALPVPEPGDVARAAALDFADVGAHLDALAQQLAACKEKMKKVIKYDSHNQMLEESTISDSSKRTDVFKEKMTTFINLAEEKLKTEYENLDDCRSKFIATVKFYQYTPKCGKLEECEPKEFFSLWTSFCTDFKDIYKKEEQIAIKEKLKEAKKLQDERRSQTQPKKEGGLKARLQKLSTNKK